MMKNRAQRDKDKRRRNTEHRQARTHNSGILSEEKKDEARFVTGEELSGEEESTNHGERHRFVNRPIWGRRVFCRRRAPTLGPACQRLCLYHFMLRCRLSPARCHRPMVPGMRPRPLCLGPFSVS